MTSSATAKFAALLVVFAALLVVSVVASAAFASSAHALDVKLVNESGKSPTTSTSP
jgi:hypothetical protein